MTTAVGAWGATDLSARLTTITDAIAAAAAALPDVVDLPDRVVRNIGGVTWDCPMVYASALTAQKGLPEPQGADIRLEGSMTWPPSNNSAWQIVVECGIVRPVSAQPVVVGSSATSPRVADYDADMLVSASDLAVLCNAADALAHAGQPVPRTGAAAGEQGTFHGWVLTLTVEPWAPAPLVYGP